MESHLRCIMPSCDFKESIYKELTECPKCGSLLDVVYSGQDAYSYKELFKCRRGDTEKIFNKSGVWRFRELLPFPLTHKNPEEIMVSLDGKEGQSSPFHLTEVARYVGMKSDNFYLQSEGENPTGSFKDNGMAAAFTHAKMLNRDKVVCASTGNTSASMAAFAANELGGIKAIIFIGSGKISMGKLAQSLEYGAKVIQIKGDFDDAMDKVIKVAEKENLYIMNSINPFRLEGQKTMMYRLLEGLNWQVPDWVVCPGGNLGNSSAFGKAFFELRALGLIDKMPRIAVINAKGADTLYRLYNEEGVKWNNGQADLGKIKKFYAQMDKENRRASTIASAIEINRPVNLMKTLRALEWTRGVVEEVSDQEMLDAKAIVGRNGFGCEPASAASVAGIKKLVEKGIVKPEETVVGILTGHQLKDSKVTVEYHSNKENKYANLPIEVENSAEDIIRVLE
ncbi:MAG: threonine synthase [archaeon]